MINNRGVCLGCLSGRYGTDTCSFPHNSKCVHNNIDHGKFYLVHTLYDCEYVKQTELYKLQLKHPLLALDSPVVTLCSCNLFHMMIACFLNIEFRLHRKSTDCGH